jgi:glycosyltransferase involved in cell wall biosynthesis
VRTLVVGSTWPWPATTGLRLRLQNVLSGLARLGDVDLFALVGTNDHGPYVPPSAASPERVVTASKPKPAYSGLRRLTWLARTKGQVPIHFVGRDYSDVQRTFRRWARDSYDLVWYSRIEAFIALGDSIAGRAIVDIDDLEDEKVRARLATLTMDGSRDSLALHLHRWGASVQGHKDIRLWHALQRTVAESVDAVVVCSDADRERLGMPNAFVVPNGYERPNRSVGQSSVRKPPTIVFQGLLLYPPNADAARHLVREIAPLIRVSVPDVEMRLVGCFNEPVAALHDPPRVTVTGEVPDITTELARADLVAVPIRHGGGTRIKVLEAFAHRIPVVSTSKGAEGLGVNGGAHLLIGDTAEDFAAACVRLLTNQDRRAAVAEQGYQLFLTKYESSGIQEGIARLAQRVISPKEGLLASPLFH